MSKTNKILVVEDSVVYQKYLVRELTQQGFEVTLAASLIETQNLLKNDTDFLCAVLDYCLPDALNGEVIDYVLSNNICSIVLTSNFDTLTRERVLGSGVFDYLLKESRATVNELLYVIRRLSNNRQHKALVVDDSHVIRKHIIKLLAQQNIAAIDACNGEEGIVALGKHEDITLLITDHDMPVMNGIDMVRAIRTQYTPLDLVVLGLSASEDKTLTARFLKAGSDDFLIKPFGYEEFFCRVNQLLSVNESRKELYRLAHQDALTDLWNRRYFFARPDSVVNKCESIAMIDIDKFKSINDTYGHDAGDAVITSIASTLKEHFPDETVARLGGEEFCVHSEDSIDVFCVKLEAARCSIENNTIKYGSTDLKATISIGACNRQSGLQEQLKLADKLLYKAKQTGRNRLVVESVTES